VAVRIITGDCRETLRTLPAESVNCCVSSPPYWGLRDYGHGDQIGLEQTPDEYVAQLVAVFREVRRVLRDDGTLWLNLGDSYAAHGAGHGGKEAAYLDRSARKARKAPPGLKPKDLVGIPWRVAFALQADGWWLRSDIIWAKPNPMPESVTDRPTKAHEYVFLLTKSARYWYDADAVREPHTFGSNSAKGDAAGRTKHGRGAAPPRGGAGTLGASSGMKGNCYPSAGRNARTVWTIATQPYPGAHFAVMPPALAERCIKAGTSERGRCAECGEPWNRETERTPMVVRPGPDRIAKMADQGSRTRTAIGGTVESPATSRTVGWSPSCDCGADVVPCVVLDPFGGAGTTGLVADKLGRNAILCELNPEFSEQAEGRIVGDCPLFAEVTP